MAALRRLANFIRTLLRELGDEAAYERRLRRDGRTHSGKEWRRFMDERLKARYSRAKCC
jgi:hypothetical protein